MLGEPLKPGERKRIGESDDGKYVIAGLHQVALPEYCFKRCSNTNSKRAKI